MLAKINQKKQEFKERNPKKYWTLRITGIIIMILLFFFLHAKEIEKGIDEYRKTENTEKVMKLIGDALMDEVRENGEALLRLLGAEDNRKGGK